MDISLGQLEAFVSVVENRSFSKAGEELFLSQSTISSHIAKLDRALQATLLQRREKKNGLRCRYSIRQRRGDSPL